MALKNFKRFFSSASRKHQSVIVFIQLILLFVRSFCETEKGITHLTLISEVRAHFEASFAEFTEIMEGQDVTLRCELSDEDASVVWYRNGKKVTPDERIAISVDGTERKLTIINATPKDSGDYECSTVDDRSKARGELLVKGWLNMKFACLIKHDIK